MLEHSSDTNISSPDGVGGENKPPISSFSLQNSTPENVIDADRYAKKDGILVDNLSKKKGVAKQSAEGKTQAESRTSANDKPSTNNNATTNNKPLTNDKAITNDKLSLTTYKAQNGNKSATEPSSGAQKSDEKPREQKKKRKGIPWSIKITVIALFLGAFFSFISDITASNAHIVVTVLLLFFLVLGSILFDGIGVAATSCEEAPIASMASRKVYGAKTALKLVKNNEKVASICNDVIGDIFGIITGSCSTAIVLLLVVKLGEEGAKWQQWLTIGITSVVAALTIGGKAFLKDVAINNSKEFIMFVARILAVFNPAERQNSKHAQKRNNSKKRPKSLNSSNLSKSSNTANSANSANIASVDKPDKSDKSANSISKAKSTPDSSAKREDKTDAT